MGRLEGPPFAPRAAFLRRRALAVAAAAGGVVYGNPVYRDESLAPCLADPRVGDLSLF